MFRKIVNKIIILIVFISVISILFTFYKYVIRKDYIRIESEKEEGIDIETEYIP